MPKTPCETKHSLLDQLFQSDPNCFSRESVAADGTVPPAQKSLEMKSLRLKLHACMEEWERINNEPHKHKALHGC
jgi:hypothetical protein